MKLYSGIDLVEIGRIGKSAESPRFLRRVFGERELEQYRERGCPVSYLAGSFCVKEAFSKALRTGVRGFSLREVETVRDESGCPRLVLSGRAEKLAAREGLEFSVSISHTREYAVAVVTAYCG